MMANSYLDTFIERIKTRYSQRYDIDYNDERLADTDWIDDQLQALEHEVRSNYELWMPVQDLLLLYVDWFFGYKSLRAWQSLGLLFDVDREEEAKNRIFAKFYRYLSLHKDKMCSNPNWCFEHALYSRLEYHLS